MLLRLTKIISQNQVQKKLESTVVCMGRKDGIGNSRIFFCPTIPVYYRHSDYVGGMKETTLKEMLNKKPERVIELAVKGMLPKGPLGREMYKKLFVYAGPDHKHAAQKPEVLTF